jgi:hypothetical protein
VYPTSTCMSLVLRLMYIVVWISLDSPLSICKLAYLLFYTLPIFLSPTHTLHYISNIYYIILYYIVLLIWFLKAVELATTVYLIKHSLSPYHYHTTIHYPLLFNSIHIQHYYLTIINIHSFILLGTLLIHSHHFLMIFMLLGSLSWIF